MVKIIGLMSGTSLDGVDIVCVSFEGFGKFEILHAYTYEYPSEWYGVLKDIALLDKTDVLLQMYDLRLGEYFGRLINEFKNQYQLLEVDFIASHGHTVHHNPNEQYTLQIGCGKRISEITKNKVVYDFRKQDVLLGGQGAPLVPIVDHNLFGQYEYCLNLGGFSNVSFALNGERVAYDICPINTLLNYYSNKLGLKYDDKGNVARKGKVNKDLLWELNQLAFYKKEFPKSLGVEFLKNDVFPVLEKYTLSSEDFLATLTKHMAFQISKVLVKGEVLVTGGGAYNLYLLELISLYNPKIKIVVPDKLLVEFKEALAFAYLGLLKLNNLPNCLRSVTGASRDHSSGVVAD